MHSLDNKYAGRRGFIIATGSSLRGFDFTRLAGEITIGVNRVVDYYNPTIMHFYGTSAKRASKGGLDSYNGIIIADKRSLGEMAPVGGIHGFRNNTEYAGSSFDDGLFGYGAGATAIHVAILLGLSPIYLLGYDFYINGAGKKHFNSNAEGGHYEQVYGLCMCSCMMFKNHEIYNCNRDSLLDVYPYADINEVLSGDVGYGPRTGGIEGYPV